MSYRRIVCACNCVGLCAVALGKERERLVVTASVNTHGPITND